MTGATVSRVSDGYGAVLIFQRPDRHGRRFRDDGTLYAAWWWARVNKLTTATYADFVALVPPAGADPVPLP